MNNFYEFKKEILNKIGNQERFKNYYIDKFVSVLEYEFNVELRFVIPEIVSKSKIFEELIDFLKFYLANPKPDLFKNILIKYLVL